MSRAGVLGITSTHDVVTLQVGPAKAVALAASAAWKSAADDLVYYGHLVMGWQEATFLGGVVAVKPSPPALSLMAVLLM